MAKRNKSGEGFGEAAPKVISPLTFQRTDEGSTDSLHNATPDTSFNNLPKDTAGFIPKCEEIDG